MQPGFPFTDTASAPATPEGVARTFIASLQAYRMPVGSEADFQVAVAEVLTRGNYTYSREHDLGDAGRIDFFLPAVGLGLELKVQGSPSDVARQLLRYAQSPEIAALVLITGRARLGALPPTLNGKPLFVAGLWRNLL